MSEGTEKVRVRVCECGARYATPGVAQMHKCPLNDGGRGTFRTVTEVREAAPRRISYQPGYAKALDNTTDFASAWLAKLDNRDG